MGQLACFLRDFVINTNARVTLLEERVVLCDRMHEARMHGRNSDRSHDAHHLLERNRRQFGELQNEAAHLQKLVAAASDEVETAVAPNKA